MSTPTEAEIASGALARQGLLDRDAVDAAAAIIDTMARDGIETLRVLFADQHGILRGKTLAARAVVSAFRSGVGIPSTLLLKDTAHRTVFDVWSADGGAAGLALGGGDVVMVPDPATFRRLPWSPHSALVLCDLADRAGRPIPIAPRAVLRGAEARLAARGLRALMGLEVEFQVFERLDPMLGHAEATMPPAPVATRNLTQGWQYLTETRYGEVEDLLDTLRRHADSMGLAPRSAEIEMGPSQFEFTFDASGPMEQADRFVLFRTLVKEVCQRRGLHATFMARPRLPNAAANGWHIHQSLAERDSGRNLFTPGADGALTPQAAGWIAGLLAHAEASCLLTTPTINGYKRYAPFQLAPNRVQWGRDNRGAMIRALMFPGDPASRIENRAPDTTANPYFALAAQVLSGLDGIDRADAPPPATEDPYAGARLLPTTLIAAVEAFEGSALYRTTLGEDVVAWLARIKRAEWDRYLASLSEWEQAEYFNLF